MSVTQDRGAAVGDAWVQSLRLATMVCHEPNYNLRARAAVILVGCACSNTSLKFEAAGSQQSSSD